MLPTWLQAELHPGPSEEEYRRRHLKEDVRQCIVVGSIWLIPNFFFAVADYNQYGGQSVFSWLLSLRLVFLAVYLTGFLVLNRVRKAVTYDWLVFILSFYSLIHIFILNISRPDIHIHHAVIDVLVLFTIYVLVPNRFILRLLPGLTFTALTLFHYFKVRAYIDPRLLSLLFWSFFLANVLGIWASLRFHATRRKQFDTQSKTETLGKNILHSASTDELTGIANRRFFLRTAEAEYERFLRYKRPFSVLMVDIDHFKKINDRFGHAVGDEALRLVAKMLSDSKRETDLIGRIGGEEFALLLPETGLSGATDIAVRLRRSCHSVNIHTLEPVFLTVSIGATQARTGDASFDDILRRADAALYQAKNAGRDRVEVD